MSRNTPLEFRRVIQEASSDAAALERFYREAVSSGREESFRDTIAAVIEEKPATPLLASWGYRLEILPLDFTGQVAATTPGTVELERSRSARSWALAVGISVVLGLVWVLLAGGEQATPFPNPDRPWFWLGWAPATAVGILAYLVFAGDSLRLLKRHGAAAAMALVLAIPASWPVWHRADDVAILTALHLPLLVFLILGGAVTGGLAGQSKAWFSYIVKSAEILLTAAIYLVAGGIFGGLTFGIFAVLGVELPPTFVQRVMNFALGLIPLLAVASVYDPRMSPATQDVSQGPIRLLRLFARLLLPAVVLVLAMYVLWFVPQYFWRPFRERDVLVVYNLTIAAILGLMAVAVPQPRERLGEEWQRWLRYVIVTAGVLTTALNGYALAAVLSRTFHFGITPNRITVIGWNVVTLLVLLNVLVTQLRQRSDDWAASFEAAIVRPVPIAAIWIAWVVFATPLLGL